MLHLGQEIALGGAILGTLCDVWPTVLRRINDNSDSSYQVPFTTIALINLRATDRALSQISFARRAFQMH